MRWMIVEDSLESRNGHWFEYLSGFMNELPRLGEEATLLVSNNAEPFIKEKLAAFPVLPESAFKDMSDGASALRRCARVPVHAWRTFWAIRRFLKDHPTPDIFFVPTVIVHHLLGWVWLLKSILCRRSVRVLLFFPGLPIHRKESSALLDGSPTARVMRLLFRVMTDEIRTGKVILGVETEAMRKTAQMVFGVPFFYLPHPVESSISNHEPSTSLTMACYGPARHEKGSDILVAAIEQYLNRFPNDRVKFVIQWLGDFSLPDGTMADLPAGLLRHPQVEIVRRLFDDGEYAHWLGRTDVMLLPYRRSSYGLRVSRVVIEAMVNGIPVVVTRGTTLAEQAEEFGASTLCEDCDVESLVQAIDEMEQHFVGLKHYAEKQKHGAREHFSLREFRRRVVVSDPSNIEGPHGPNEALAGISADKA